MGRKYALKFLQEVDGIFSPEAMQVLQGDFPNYVPTKPTEEEKKPTPFVLPKQAPDNRKIWNYLKGRKICREVFDDCVNLGIYDSVEKSFKREQGGSGNSNGAVEFDWAFLFWDLSVYTSEEYSFGRRGQKKGITGETSGRDCKWWHTVTHQEEERECGLLWEFLRRYRKDFL